MRKILYFNIARVRKDYYISEIISNVKKCDNHSRSPLPPETEEEVDSPCPGEAAEKSDSLIVTDFGDHDIIREECSKQGDS